MTRETLRASFVLISGLAFIVAFALFGVLLRGVTQPALRPLPKETNETTQSSTSFKLEKPAAVLALERALGVIRETGLSGITGEKERLNLTISDFELALPSDLPALLGKDKVNQLVFEDKNFDYSKFIGNCVEIGYSPQSDIYNANRENLMGYSLFPVVVWEVNILDRSKCSVYKATLPTTSENLSFTGKLQRFERPSPDIGYDYKLILETPYLDTNNASGLNQKVNSLIIVPANNEIWDQFEKNMFNTVTVSGDFEWGYAESKYFLVTKVL